MSDLNSISRRRLLTMAALGAGTLGLAACSGPSAVSSSSKGASKAAEKVDYADVKPATDITFWTNNPGGSGDVTKRKGSPSRLSRPAPPTRRLRRSSRPR